MVIIAHYWDQAKYNKGGAHMKNVEKTIIADLEEIYTKVMTNVPKDNQTPGTQLLGDPETALGEFQKAIGQLQGTIRMINCEIDGKWLSFNGYYAGRFRTKRFQSFREFLDTIALLASSINGSDATNPEKP